MKVMIDNKPKIEQHTTNDWCHLCGERSTGMADVWYPKNAEHNDECAEYIRICRKCAFKIDIAARNARGL